MFDTVHTLPVVFWALAAVATFLVGMAKAGFAGTAANLAVPLLALAVPAPFAAAVLLPILLTLDAIGLVVFRGRFDRRQLAWLLPGALLGVAFGWLLFEYIEPRWIRVLVGVEAVAFAFDRLRPSNDRAAPADAPASSGSRGAAWGALAGFTSFISHAGGPPLMHYLLPQRLEKMRLVGTVTIFFSIVNFAKLAPYVQLGLLDLSNLAVSAMLLPVVPLGYWLGYRLMNAIDLQRFQRVLSWLLLATGIALIWGGVS